MIGRNQEMKTPFVALTMIMAGKIVIEEYRSAAGNSFAGRLRQVFRPVERAKQRRLLLFLCDGLELPSFFVCYLGIVIPG